MEHDRSWLVRLALKETDCLYQVWDSVRDARCEYYYITVRRQALKKLHPLLGPDAYAGGEWPPHVPLWRFSENGLKAHPLQRVGFVSSKRVRTAPAVSTPPR